MMMKDVLGLIMGGGRGTRLYPLTEKRSKPAVSFAGKYRLIIYLSVTVCTPVLIRFPY